MRLLASSCLFVCPHGTSRLPLVGFSLNLIFKLFYKVRREDWWFIKIQQDQLVLYIKTFFTFMTISRRILKMKNVLDKIVEKIKTHISYSLTFLRKSCRLWDNVEKCGGARETTNDVTIWRIRVACWMSKATCTHTHAHVHTQICNVYRFSTATMIR